MDSFSIYKELKRIESLGLRRSLRTLDSPQGGVVSVEGRELINFSSNDYLGLANHRLVKKAAIESIEKWGFGSGSSRLVSGNTALHEALEERIRRFKDADAAIVFNSGYHANLGVIGALADRGTDVFSDRLNHASIVDACVLSRGNVLRYRHGDTGSLERMLRKSKAKKRLIVTDSVFSMDGDIAPIDEIAGLLDRYDAMLFVDDAHATGVLGKNGRGGLEHFSIKKHPSIIEMGTLGKSVGAFGAFVAGSVELIGFLKSRSRPFIYTTALPPCVAAASIKAFDVMEENPGLRLRLKENSEALRRGLNERGLYTLDSSTQIIPVLTGGVHKTMEISRLLFEKGLFIQGIRPPTVPAGTARLRLSAHALHTGQDIKKAVTLIKEAIDGSAP
ncbi:MAG: 8-amino-7-oxononanoate synthase [Deltaproteobacteria bacterium]